jgi:hypothetical protein
MGLRLRLTTAPDGAAASARAVGAADGPDAWTKLVATISGPRIDFVYTPEPKDLGTKIVFIQVMKNILDGTPVLPSKVFSGFSYRDKDTTARFYHVDYTAGEKDPYYNGDDKGNDIGKQGNAFAHVSPGVSAFLDPFLPGLSAVIDLVLESATMFDGPDYPDAFFPTGKSKVRWEFRTAAFSADGADKGTYYQYVDWVYEKEKGKAATLTLGTGGTDPGPDFKAAVELWSKNHGFHLPKPAPAPAPAPPGPVPPPGAKKYVVKSGDYLSKIAQATYGNGNLWPKIYTANKAVIGPDPNLIFPGQTLVLPP